MCNIHTVHTHICMYIIVGAKFGLHPLTIEDVTSKDTREKLEIFRDYLLVIFHSGKNIFTYRYKKNMGHVLNLPLFGIFLKLGLRLKVFIDFEPSLLVELFLVFFFSVRFLPYFCAGSSKKNLKCSTGPKVF